MSLIPTAEYTSLTPDTVSPRLAFLPADCTEPREVLQHDEALVAQDSHVGGCLRGVLFALVFQSAILSLCVLLFKMWRMMR